MKRKSTTPTTPSKKTRNDFLGVDFGRRDYSHLPLCQNHESKPFIVMADNHILLETFSPLYEQANEFLNAIAEPVSRPHHLHEYKITEYSLYSAASMGITSNEILFILEKLSKFTLDKKLEEYILQWTATYESTDHRVLKHLLEDSEISDARSETDIRPNDTKTGFYITERKQEADSLFKNLLKEDELQHLGRNDSNGHVTPLDENSTNIKIYSFSIKTDMQETVKKACQDCKYPVLEEYHFHQDSKNPSLKIDLGSKTVIRSYQEKCLSKMFGHGRARSGVIVLPCGSGKTLVGIVATTTIKKSTLILCNSTVSIEQWYKEFTTWTNVNDDDIYKFTSDSKPKITSKNGVIVLTTYQMLTFGGKRNEKGHDFIKMVQDREWGLIIFDEVHVAPAETFRKVIQIAKAHCKLGLTATLVREDDKTNDLNWIIGPKLFEANWMDLQNQGYLARVECLEVWCDMTPEYYSEYLTLNSKLLTIMNPNKFGICKHLIKQHEERGDKIIVFSDDIYSLLEYAKLLNYPFIYGPTSNKERVRILNEFSTSNRQNCIFISKVGDTSLDIPSCNVIIQISSQFGSRRQEAQRLGRILRPKEKTRDKYNAFFYTLISRDTTEMFYNQKRQQFLIDQGYAYRVIQDMKFDPVWNQNEQTHQLHKIKVYLSMNKESMDDLDDVQEESRNTVSLSSLSGGDEIVYVESKNIKALKKKFLQ